MNTKIKIKGVRLIKTECFREIARGDLYVCEAPKNLPFKAERLFWITNVPNKKVIRAGHAHRKVKEVMFAMKGSFRLNLDDGSNKQKILLNNPEMGIYLSPQVWRRLNNFSKDCTVLVIAEKRYDKNDYIDDYEEFKKIK